MQNKVWSVCISLHPYQSITTYISCSCALPNYVSGAFFKHVTDNCQLYLGKFQLSFPKLKIFFLFWDYTEVKTTPNQHIDYFDSLQGEKKLKNYYCCWSFTSPEQLCRAAKSLNIFILFWEMLLSHQTIRNWNMLHVAQRVTLLPLELWVMGHHFLVPRPSSGKTNFPGEGQPSKSKHYLWSHFNLTVIPTKKKQVEVSEKSTTQKSLKKSYMCSRNSNTFMGTTYSDVYSVQGTTFFRTYTLRWYLFKKLADNSSMAVLHLQHCTNKLTTIKQNIRNRITLFIISSEGRLIIIIII